MICRSLVDPETTNGMKQPRTALVEADSGIPIMEADSKPIAEADSSKPIVEAERRSVIESGSYCRHFMAHILFVSE